MLTRAKVHEWQRRFVFPLAPLFERFDTAHEAALSKVADGATVATANSADGYSVRVQRIDGKVYIHVWRGMRLLRRKADWPTR